MSPTSCPTCRKCTCTCHDAHTDAIRGLRERVTYLERCVREAYEVWAGSEIGAPVYASAAYAIEIIRRMVGILGPALVAKRSSPDSEVSWCAGCQQFKAGWPDTWRNRPGHKGLQYVCAECAAPKGNEP